MVWVVFLWVAFEGRPWRKFKAVWDVDIWFFILKKPSIFEKIFDSLFLILNNNGFFLFVWMNNFDSVLIILREAFLFGLYLWPWTHLIFLAVLEGWWWVADITSIDVVIKHDHLSFLFWFMTGRLYWIVSSFFAFSFVHFIDGINFSDNFTINLNSWFRVKLFFF